jgi:hypothetical protein
MLEPQPPKRTRAPPSPDATPPFTLATQDTHDDTTQSSETETNHMTSNAIPAKRHTANTHWTIKEAKKRRTSTNIKDIRKFFPTCNTPSQLSPADNNTNRHVRESTHIATKRKATNASTQLTRPPNELSNAQPLQKFLVPQESTQQPHIPKPYLDALLANNKIHAPRPIFPNNRHSKQPTANSHAYTLRPQLDLSNHMTFNSDITSTWRAADEILFQTNNEGNFKAATWNCNQMTETKAEYIAWYVASMEIDVLFIQDTRMTPVMYKAVSYRLNTLLGCETFVASSIKAHTNYTVGGQIVIVNSNLKQKSMDSGATPLD